MYTYNVWVYECVSVWVCECVCVFVCVSVCLCEQSFSQYIIDTKLISFEQKITDETAQKFNFHGGMSRNDTGAITGAEKPASNNNK